MHDSKIEKIIEELYAIDPSLKERANDLYELVAMLIESKPMVTVDTLFLDNLRKELFNRIRTPEEKVPHPSPFNFSWFVTRLVPLAGVAILIFMLVPSSPTSGPINTPYTTSPAREMDISSDAVMKSGLIAPQSKSMKFRDPIILSAITLDRPGFVVVQTDTQEIVGVSKFLLPGTTVGVQINFIRGVATNESLTGVLYTDNGDGVFGPTDTPSPATYIDVNQ
jgi:hypothetical protein